MGLHTESVIESKQIINQSGCEELPMCGHGLYKRPGNQLCQVKLPIFLDEDLKFAIQTVCRLYGR